MYFFVKKIRIIYLIINISLTKIQLFPIKKAKTDNLCFLKYSNFLFFMSFALELSLVFSVIMAISLPLFSFILYLVYVI